MTSAFKSYVNSTGSSSGITSPSSYGYIYIAGSATNPRGALELEWSNNANQGLTLQAARGASVDVDTGVVTLSQAGVWKITFTGYIIDTATNEQLTQLNKGTPPGGTTLVASQSKTTEVGDWSNVAISAIDDAVVVGDTYYVAINSPDMEYTNASFIAEQIA